MHDHCASLQANCVRSMWYPQIQFNLLCFDPATGHKEWRSTSVSGFTTAPTIGSTKYDKRSCKSNEFTFLVDPAKSDTYTIEGKYDANTQVSLKVKRMEGAPGFKLGSGPKGGMTYFGAEKTAAASGEGGPDYASASDGYVVHRFWPRCTASGVLRIGNDIVTLDDKAGARGIFIHAIQGMRPNLVACRWNFGYFSGTDASEGVSLMSMEFTTTYTHGNQTVNIGSVVADDRLVAVIADGTTRHLDTDPVDSDTGYPAPGKVQFSWKNGASLQPDMSKTPVSAEITLELGATGKTKSGGRAFNGLIEKVDVLAQIPYLVKKVISYVAGTKPYIYQFLNPTTATLTLPGQTGSEDRKLTVKGYMFNEATFISPN